MTVGTSVSVAGRLGLWFLGAGAMALAFFAVPVFFVGEQPIAPTAPTLSTIPPADDRSGTVSTLSAVSDQQHAADAAFLHAVGRPSVDAVWNGRMRLAPPGEWVKSGKATASLAPVILAYAPTDERRRNPAPFAAIDAVEPPANAGTAPASQNSSLPVTKAPATTGEDDEEDDDEDVPAIIPRPLPRPRIAAANPQSSLTAATPLAAKPAPAANDKSADPAGIRQALALAPLSAAPPVAPRPREELNENQRGENQNYVLIDPRASNINLASRSPEPPLERATPPLQAAPTTPIQPAITLKTPFGIPYALQQESVEASCFPPPLVDLIHRIEQRYGQKPLITSGLRDRGRRGSLHRRCQAADLMIPGVSASALAKVAREIPGMGGVGQYCHPNLVHIDIGTARDWKQGCGGYFALRDSAAKAR